MMIPNTFVALSATPDNPATPDADLINAGEDATVRLLARHVDRMGADVARAARAGAAPREDLEHSAIVGFLSALADYDPTRGTGVYTYARSRVMEELEACNRSYSARPASVKDHQRFWLAMKVCDHDPIRAREWTGLQRLTGHALQELADGGNTLAEDILHMRITSWERRGLDVTAMMSEHGRGLTGALFDAIHQSLMYVSTDATVGGELTVADVAEDTEAQTPITAIDDHHAVRQMLAELPDRDRDILACLYGLNTPELTVRQVADKHGIAPSRVRAIKADACKRLAGMMRS